MSIGKARMLFRGNTRLNRSRRGWSKLASMRSYDPAFRSVRSSSLIKGATEESSVSSGSEGVARYNVAPRAPTRTVANCCQNGALYGCPKSLKGLLRDIGKISKWQLTWELSDFLRFSSIVDGQSHRLRQLTFFSIRFDIIWSLWRGLLSTSTEHKHSKRKPGLFAASGGISRIVKSVVFFYFEGNSRKDPILSSMTPHRLENYPYSATARNPASVRVFELLNCRWPVTGGATEASANPPLGCRYV